MASLKRANKASDLLLFDSITRSSGLEILPSAEKGKLRQRFVADQEIVDCDLKSLNADCIQGEFMCFINSKTVFNSNLL